MEFLKLSLCSLLCAYYYVFVSSFAGCTGANRGDGKAAPDDSATRKKKNKRGGTDVCRNSRKNSVVLALCPCSESAAMS